MLMSIILKQGMKSVLIEDESEPAGIIMQDYAIEETARQLGRDGSFGIADLLYEEMSQGAEETGREIDRDWEGIAPAVERSSLRGTALNQNKYGSGHGRE